MKSSDRYDDKAAAASPAGPPLISSDFPDLGGQAAADIIAILRMPGVDDRFPRRIGNACVVNDSPKAEVLAIERISVTHKQRKFAVGSSLIVLAIAYLAFSGFEENRTYSYSVPELYAMKDTAYGRRLQVTGDIVAGSIRRGTVAVNFIVGQSPQILQIRYIGKDAPDTLVAGAIAIATGTLGRDGVFVADSLLVLSASTGEHA